MKSHEFSMFAACVPGLEEVAALELDNLDIKGIKVIPGGVEFIGDLSTLYKVNIWFRSPLRVLVRVDTFFAAHLSELHKKSKKVPWEKFLDKRVPVCVKATCRKSRIYHSKAAAERVAKGIAERLQLSHIEGTPEKKGEMLAVLVRLEHDHVTISLDSSGANLHFRGYRTESVGAPLRENLGAAILYMSGWGQEEVLVDPMCGSGTIPIEGAMIAANIAPGLNRQFAFMNWAGFDEKLFIETIEAAKKKIRVPLKNIYASDRDAKACEVTLRNAKRAMVADFIIIRNHPVSEFITKEEKGMIICNPPYGIRIGERKKLKRLYSALGKTLEKQSVDWRLSLITSDQHLAASTGQRFKSMSAPFPNGGVRIKLYCT